MSTPVKYLQLNPRRLVAVELLAKHRIVVEDSLRRRIPLRISCLVSEVDLLIAQKLATAGVLQASIVARLSRWQPHPTTIASTHNQEGTQPAETALIDWRY